MRLKNLFQKTKKIRRIAGLTSFVLLYGCKGYLGFPIPDPILEPISQPIEKEYGNINVPKTFDEYVEKMYEQFGSEKMYEQFGGLIEPEWEGKESSVVKNTKTLI